MLYVLMHDWNFANGEHGHYEVQFVNVDEAFAKFKHLQKLIETDDYDFDAVIPPYVDGDMSYSIYECGHEDSFVNRQDLVLKQFEVPYEQI